MADGEIKIDTKLDDTKFKKGLSDMGEFAKTAFLGITATIGIATGMAAKFGMEFESSLAKTKTMFGSVAVDMKNLEKKTLELSTATGVAASEIAESMYDALSSGIPVTEDMGDAISYMDKSARLAKAGFTDINTAVMSTAKVLNAYKMDVSETDRVHRIMMATQNKGITTVDELGKTLAGVTPTASAMNVSFEQVGASLATMTSQGTPTSQAITQLNGLFADLGKKGTISQKALAEAVKGTKYAGKSFQDMAKDGVPLNTMLDLLNTYAKKNKLSLIDMFGSIESGKAALALSGQNSASFTANLKEMSTQADLVGDAVKIIDDTVGEKFKKAMNEGKNEMIKLYNDGFKPILAEAIPLLVTGIKFLFNNFQMIVAITAGFGIVLGGLWLVMEGGAIITMVTEAMVALNIAMAANPVGIIIIGITALIAVMAILSIGKNKEAEESAKLVKQVDAENKAWNDLKATKEQQMGAALAELNYSEKLWAELQRLTDAKGMINDSDKARVQFILNELNSAMGTQMQLVDNEVKGYEKVGKSIDALIEQKRAKIIMDSQEVLYKEALIKYEEKQIEQAKLKIALAQKEKEYNEVAKWDIVGANRIAKEFDDLAKKYSENEVVLKQYYKHIGTYEENSKAMTEKRYGDIKKIIDNNANAFITAEDVRKQALGKQKETLLEQVVVMKTTAELVKKAWTDGTAGVTEQMVKDAEAKAKEAEAEYAKVGAHIISGMVMGIENGKGKVTGATGNVVYDALIAAKNAGVIKSPSRKMRDEVGLMLSRGIAVGVTQGSGEVSKAFTKMLTDLDLQRDTGVINEQEYYDKLTVLRNKYLKQGTSEWWEYTKQVLNYEDKLAEDETKLLKEKLDKQKETITSSFREIISEIDTMMNDVEQKQNEFADKLKNFVEPFSEKTITLKNVGKNFNLDRGSKQGEDWVINEIDLTDLKRKNKELESYSNLLDKVKARGNVPQKFLNDLQQMSIVDGSKFANALLGVSDTEFESYMNDWSKLQENILKMSKDQYSEEFSLVGQQAKAKLMAQFDLVPDEFKENGKLSATKFEEGFMTEFNNVWNRVKTSIQVKTNSIGSGEIKNPIGKLAPNSNTETSIYNVTAKTETLSSQISQIEADKIFKKMIGVN